MNNLPVLHTLFSQELQPVGRLCSQTSVSVIPVPFYRSQSNTEKTAEQWGRSSSGTREWKRRANSNSVASEDTELYNLTLSSYPLMLFCRRILSVRSSVSPSVPGLTADTRSYNILLTYLSLQGAHVWSLDYFLSLFPIFVYVHPSIHSSIQLSIHPSVPPSINLSVHPST